jgi:hypothetical protein
MQLITRVKQLLQAASNRKEQPKYLHLTPSDEIETLSLSQDDLGKENYKIVMTDGPRRLKQLFGLTLVFDANKTSVD